MTVLASMLLLRFKPAVLIGAASPCPVLNVTLQPDQPVHLAVFQVNSPYWHLRVRERLLTKRESSRAPCVPRIPCCCVLRVARIPRLER